MKLPLFSHLSPSILAIFCCFSALPASAEQPTAEVIFLDVDDAFKLNIDNTQNGTALIWQIAPDYYLYKHKFKLAILPATQHEPNEKVDITATTTFSKGLRKSDDYYGQVEVYYHQAIAELNTKQLTANHAKRLEISYQGCADAGLCYPVQTRIIELP